MKLVLITLVLLAWPMATWWAEAREDGEERRNINRMADRDRRSQAVRPMSRRMRYARIEKPALLQQRGRPIGGADGKSSMKV